MKKLILILILIFAIASIAITDSEIVYRVDFMQTDTCAGTANENASGTLYVTYDHKDGSLNKIKLVVKNCCLTKNNDLYVQKTVTAYNTASIGHFTVNIHGNGQFVMDREYIYRYGMHFEQGEMVYIANHPEKLSQPRMVILYCEFP